MDKYYLFLFIGFVIIFWILFSAPTIQKIIMILRKRIPSVSALPSKGSVAVIGITGPKILETPINKLSCVAWQIEVQEMIKKVIESEHSQMPGGYGYSWKTIRESTSIDLFTISDNTGSILIQPSSSKMILNTQVYIPNPNITTINLLDPYTDTNTLGLSSRVLVIYERFVPPKKQVYVIGEINQSNKTMSSAQRKIAAQVISDRLDHLNIFYTRRLLINLGYAMVIIIFGCVFYIASLY